MLKLLNYKQTLVEVLGDKGLELDKLIDERHLQELGKDVGAVTGALSSAVTDVTGAITDTYSSVTDALTGGVSNIWWCSLGVSGVAGLISGAAPSLGSFADDAAARLTGGTTGGTGDICDLVPNLELPA